ncbi:MAG: hypothetical protein AAF608_01635 [Pseudomonadota bacterium]
MRAVFIGVVSVLAWVLALGAAQAAILLIDDFEDGFEGIYSTGDAANNAGFGVYAIGAGACDSFTTGTASGSAFCARDIKDQDSGEAFVNLNYAAVDFTGYSALRFDLAAGQPGGNDFESGDYFLIKVGGTKIFELTGDDLNTIGSAFTTLTVSLAGISGVDNLRFKFSNSESAERFGLDNVSLVTETPVAASLILILTGLGVLGSLRVTRRVRRPGP